MGLEIFVLLVGEEHGLLDAFLTMEPNGVDRVSFSLKNPEVLLLPETPENKPRDELPNYV